jgi:LPS O-antigen subunit length determinant protein (WzzB/FepE family)
MHGKTTIKIIALLFSISALNGVGVQLQTLAAVTVVKRPDVHYTGGQVVHRAGLESRGEETFSFTQRGSNSEPSSW